MSKQDMVTIEKAFNDQGIQIAEVTKKMIICDEIIDIELRLKQGDYNLFNWTDVSKKLSDAQKQSGYYVLPKRSEEISIPETFMFNRVRLIKISYLTRKVSILHKYAKELDNSYWVLQGKKEAIELKTNLSEWLEGYGEILIGLKTICTYYNDNYHDLFETVVMELNAMDRVLIQLESDFWESNCFADEEPLLNIIYKNIG